MKKHPTLLQVLRQQAELTQPELAIACGMTQAFISLVERRLWTSAVHEETLRKMAVAVKHDGDPNDLLLPAVVVTK